MDTDAFNRLQMNYLYRKNTLKKFLRWSLGFIAVLLVIAVSLIGRIDRTPLKEQSFYQHTMSAFGKIAPAVYQPKTKLKVSWAAINITPNHSMPMAGYAPRNHFDSVHDSVYVRILEIDNGTVQCFIICADLLLFPPALKNKIVAAIEQKNKNQFLYFTATHAHSSLGAWNDSFIGNIILGQYDEEWINDLTDKIVSAIDFISKHSRPATINYFEANADEYVENRLDSQNGKIDGTIRGLKIVREDGTKALLASYSGHPTNISHLSLALSGDYPNALVKKEEEKNYDFAIFTAGMIGSHRVKWQQEHEFEMCDSVASRLSKKIQSSTNFPIKDSTVISTAIFPVEYGASQLHILQDYKVRDWAFRLLFQKLQGDIRYLKIGNLILLGMPCDFSGEIFVRDELGKIAENKNEKLFITSFNGDYVGYITYDEHYGHSEQEEVMAMNWVGPFYGEYYSHIIKKILEK